jgi:hypothetical protein
VASRLHQADSLWSRGNAELALGRWDEAAASFAGGEAVSREMAFPAQVLNALEGQARVALARGDAAAARVLAERLLDEAQARAGHDAPTTEWLGGTYEHLIRLTLHRTLGGSDARAARLLDEGRAALLAEADRIDDADLRRSFLERIAENRAILAA